MTRPRAHRWLCALGEDERTSILPLFPMDVADEARLVHIALAAQDDELAAHAAAAAQHRVRLNPMSPPSPPPLLTQRACSTTAKRAWPKRWNCTRRGPRPLALAAALEDLGVAIVEDGPADEGVDVFGRALELYAQAGSGLGRRQGAGPAPGTGGAAPPGPAQRPGRGWAAMTDSELAVARLVAQGLTNREVAERLFVSHHTVSGHLRHVFAKLDVNSRVELTRLAGVHDWRP